MTQAIHSTTITSPEFNPCINTQSQRDLAITLLAVAAISSLAAMLVLPLQISLPLSVLLIGGALVCSYAISQSEQSSVIIQTDAPRSLEPVIVSEPAYYYNFPFIIHRSRCTEPGYRSWIHSYHAPVGSGTVTPVVHNRTCSPGGHAPVGSKTITPLVQGITCGVDHPTPASVGFDGWRTMEPLFNSGASSSSSIGPGFFSAARAPVGHR